MRGWHHLSGTKLKRLCKTGKGLGALGISEGGLLSKSDVYVKEESAEAYRQSSHIMLGIPRTNTSGMPELLIGGKK
jgi:hypothetical protein